MTHYGGRELAASFRTVRGNTIQIAEEIPEASYHFRVADGCRTIAQTLAHIAVAAEFQTYVHRNGYDDFNKVNFADLVQHVRADEAKPRTKVELIELLKTRGEQFASYLAGLSESFLAEQVTLRTGETPPVKSRFELLLSPKEHEMHHRGQLMVMQRMLGLTPHLTRQMQERMAAQAAQAAAR
jgi:uncharacterized damage-inducible protein DinB